MDEFSVVRFEIDGALIGIGRRGNFAGAEEAIAEGALVAAIRGLSDSGALAGEEWYSKTIVVVVFRTLKGLAPATS